MDFLVSECILSVLAHRWIKALMRCFVLYLQDGLNLKSNQATIFGSRTLSDHLISFTCFWAAQHYCSTLFWEHRAIQKVCKRAISYSFAAFYFPLEVHLQCQSRFPGLKVKYPGHNSVFFPPFSTFFLAPRKQAVFTVSVI